MPYKTMTVLCGLPRCGKSTWVAARKRMTREEVVICPDQIRAQIFGHQFYKEAEDFVWATVKAFTKILLAQDVNVIIDATNVTNKRRDLWISLAAEYNYDVHIVYFNTSLETCLRRNVVSSEGNKLPESVIERMHDTFEPPVYDGYVTPGLDEMPRITVTTEEE